MTSSPHAVPPAPPEAMPESSNGTNVGLVARREYIERVRSRAFVFSTLLLIGLAVVVALIPLGVRLLDRATVTQVGVVADDAALAARAVAVMDSALNAPLPGGDPGVRKFDFEPRTDAAATAEEVRNGVLAGAILINRKPDKGLDFQVLTTGALSPDRAQLLQIGAFGVGILDWTASQPASSTPFVLPSFSVVDASSASPDGGERPGGRHRRVRQPADRRHRVRGALVPDPRVLRAVGRIRRRGGEGEPGHGAADLRRDRAPAGRRQDQRDRARRPHAGDPRAPARGGRAPAVRAPRRVDLRHGRGRRAVARRPVAGPPPRVPRVLRAGLRALRGDVRGGGLAAQPPRGPPDRGPAAVDPRDHGLLPGRPRALRRRRRRSSGSRPTCRCGARS